PSAQSGGDAAPQRHAQEQQWEAGAPKRRPAIQQIAATPLHSIENATATEPGQAQLEAQPATYAVADETAAIEAVASGRDAGIDGVGPWRREPPSPEVRFQGAGAALHIERHVEPAGAPVATEVLPEVGQLQRGAQGIRRTIKILVVIAGDAQHQSSDWIR